MNALDTSEAINRSCDVIVLGAGAAGLMCAIEAGKRGRRVIVLERAERVGKKILISGGGRCNFTNLHTSADNFLSANPHFAKSALARYLPTDFIRLVEKHGIAYHEKKLGQLFCDRAASDITSMLEAECRSAGVEVHLNVTIAEVKASPEPGEPFAVTTHDSTFSAPSVVVATGGLSIAKIGATSFGYELAKKFGLGIVEPRPALVPLTFTERERKRWCDLAGVSTEVVASTIFGSTGVASERHESRKTYQFREQMLVTHRGVSGPAVLQISSYWNGRDPISLDLAPGRKLVEELRRRGPRDQGSWKMFLKGILPKRLADRWLEAYPTAGNSDRDLAAAEQRLHDWQIKPEGTEGYGKAEVTAGGVNTNELSAKTMESSKIPGLFFIGEVVDVTGQLGGFNFQWAWASGYVAGQAA